MSNRPDYADFNAPQKFVAIESIVAKRLIEHPNAICSYSGGSDSDVLIDVIERVRKMFPKIKPVRYVFFNTGLEMKAIRNHVKETSEKYGVQIDEIRPKVNIVQAVRKCGIPFISKITSTRLGIWQKRDIPLSIIQEYDEAEDQPAKYNELKERYPKSAAAIAYLCSCTGGGSPYRIANSLFAVQHIC